MSDDLRQLLVDLEDAGKSAERESYRALRFEAHAMRDDWRERVAGARGLPGLAPALSYDLLPSGLRSVTAEVGYDKSGQGELGNLAEFGSSTQGPIRPAGEDVVRAGADRYEDFLGGLADRTL